MDSATEQHDKIELHQRIHNKYFLLTGDAIPAFLFNQVKVIPFGDTLELTIKLDTLCKDRIPLGGVDGILEESIARGQRTQAAPVTKLRRAM